MSNELGISHQNLYCIIHKEKVLKAHMLNLKPTLIEENCLVRVKYCLEWHEPVFDNKWYQDGFVMVFPNEKKFETVGRSNRTYLAVDKEDPYRTVKNKNYLP